MRAASPRSREISRGFTRINADLRKIRVNPRLNNSYLPIKIIALTIGPSLRSILICLPTGGEPMPQNRVSIFDTTLRDGEQSPGCSMNLTEKVRMAQKLQDLGVDIIEAGFPIASEGDFAAVRAVAAQCRKVKVAALCRTSELDVARAADALKYAVHPRIHTFCATSDIHLEHKLKKTRAEVIEMTRAAVSQARNYADDVEFSAEDATRSDIDYLCEVLDAAVEAGASVLNVPDTVGYTTPNEYTRLVQQVRERVVRDRDDALAHLL